MSNKVNNKFENIDFNNKKYIIDNKKSTSRTTVEQAAELGGKCLSTKVICKSITLKNEPSNIIKNKVKDVLKECNHIMKLKYDNKKD